MNDKNLDYLTKQIKFTGFGEAHAEELKTKMQQHGSSFTLTHQQNFGSDKTNAELHFRKSESSGMYFFNNFNLQVKNEKVDSLKQDFYLSNKENNITLKEAYNLMSGRSVNKDLTTKEGTKYNAWIELDFKSIDKNGNYEMKKFHQNYGFDLNQSLAKHPINELSNEQEKSRLEDSLKRGNRQAVTLQEGGKEHKVFIEAAPKFKTINFYDGGLKRVNTQNLYENGGEKQEAKKESVKQKSGVEDEGGPGKSQTNTRKKGHKIS